MKTSTIPETITASRSITYDSQQVADDIAEAYGKPVNEVTLGEVMEWIRENAEEDLTCLEGAIYQDENGREINE
jgi:hypothetical protein